VLFVFWFISAMSIPGSVHTARNRVDNEFKRYRKQTGDLHLVMKAMTAYQHDLQRTSKSGMALANALSKAADNYQSVANESKGLPQSLSYLDPSPVGDNPVCEGLAILAERQKKMSTILKEQADQLKSNVFSSFQSEAKLFEEDILFLENDLDDMNTRYDWAIDKLKHFGDKEKKKGDSSRIQKMGKAINDKCGAIEEHRYEMVAELYFLTQMRFLQLARCAASTQDAFKKIAEGNLASLNENTEKVAAIQEFPRKLKNLKWRKDDLHFLKLDTLKADYDLKGANWGGVTSQEVPPPRPPPTPVSTQEMMESLENSSQERKEAKSLPPSKPKEFKKKKSILKGFAVKKKQKADNFVIGEPENFQKKNRDDLANMGFPTNMLPNATVNPDAGAPPPPPPSGDAPPPPPSSSSPSSLSPSPSSSSPSVAPPPPPGGDRGSAAASPPPEPQRSAAPAPPVPVSDRESAPAPPVPVSERQAAPPPPVPVSEREAAPAPPVPASDREAAPAPPSEKPPVRIVVEERAASPPPPPPPARDEEMEPEPSPQQQQLQASGGGGERKPLTTVKVVKTLYDSTADAEGELSFDEDEFIVVFDFNDPDWWHGMSNGIVGYFPASYVHEDFEMSEVPPVILEQAHLIQEQQSMEEE